MGTYSTYTSLQTLMLGVDFSLTSNQSLGTLAISRAETEINKYLSKRYDISSTTFQTSTSVPPMIRDLCNELSCGYMYKYLSRGGVSSYDKAKEFIDPVIENLKLIKDYEVDLLNTAGSIIAEGATSAFRIQSNTDTYSSTFDEDSELSWEVDKDKLEDISNGRD